MIVLCEGRKEEHEEVVLVPRYLARPLARGRDRFMTEVSLVSCGRERRARRG